MITRYRLDHAFGPSGKTAGIVLLISGAIATYYSFAGVILIFIGAFVGFTGTCCYVDTGNKRIKFSNLLFGILPTGKWMKIGKGMKLEMHRSKHTYTTYSRSNRRLNIPVHSWVLVLIDSNGQVITPMVKVNSLETARNEMRELNNALAMVTNNISFNSKSLIKNPIAKTMAAVVIATPAINFAS